MNRIPTFIMILVCTYASAQTIDDVLRYSTENLQGTARFQAMGGAFGALGGDLSALNVNPAGSAVFNYSEIGLTGSNYHSNNDVLYGGSLLNTKENSLEMNQIGGVLVFKTTDSHWRSIAVALNYDVDQNLENEFVALGNSSSRIDNYFLSTAHGVRLGPKREQSGAFI